MNNYTNPNINENKAFDRRCWAEIDLDKLAFNLNSIKRQCPDKEPIMVVKANAYGHSDVICAKEYYRLGERRFAVSNLHEAERLRNITGDGSCFLLVFASRIFYALTLPFPWAARSLRTGSAGLPKKKALR